MKITHARILIGISCFFTIIIFISINIVQHYSRAEITPDYLTEIAFSSEISYEEVLTVIEDKDRHGVMCVCIASDERGNEDIYMVFLEKKGDNHDDYNYIARDILVPSKITQDINSYSTVEPISTSYNNSLFYYGICKDPKSETIKISNHLLDIQKLTLSWDGREYHLGFWLCILPKDERITIVD